MLGLSLLFATRNESRVQAGPGSGFNSSFVGPTRFDEIDVNTQTGDHKFRIKTNWFSDIYIVTNRVLPGGHSGWHTHPDPQCSIGQIWHGDGLERRRP